MRLFAHFAGVVTVLMMLGQPALSGVGGGAADLIFTEVLFNTSGNDNDKYEWVEVLNPTADAIDLNDHFFYDFGDQVASQNSGTFGPNIRNSSSGGPATNTVIPGTTSGNNVAVLYNGFDFNYDDNRFRAGWGLTSEVPVIAVDFWPTLSNSGENRQIGIYDSAAAVEMDAPDPDMNGSRFIESFANAAVSLDYRTTEPEPDFPAGSDGVSITWNGTNPNSAGVNWVESADGVNGATTSMETLFAGGGRLNGEDFGSPDRIPAEASSLPTGLWITEIMVDPGEGPGRPAGAGNEEFEWIEIYNNTGAAIDFVSTPYVFDDNDDDDLEAANVASGSVANGATAVLFDDGFVTAVDMVTMWGAGNYIPVSDWTSMTNGGDTIALWASLADYQSEATTGPGRTVDNAVAGVTYDDDANGWPDTGGGSSLYLADFSLPLSGDFNDDSVVDLADYTLWRDNLGATDDGILGGNGSEEGESAGVVDIADYELWKSQFGQVLPGAGSILTNGTLWQRSSDDFGPPDGPGLAYPSQALNGDVVDYIAGDVGSPGVFIAVTSGAFTQVPEPSSVILLGALTLGFGYVHRQQRTRSEMTARVA